MEFQTLELNQSNGGAIAQSRVILVDERPSILVGARSREHASVFTKFGIKIRRDLLVGILFSLAIHAGAAWYGEFAAHRPKVVKAVPKPATIELIEMPKLEPDDPDPVDPDMQQQSPIDITPPMQVDVPSITTDTSFVQRLEPPPVDTASMNKGAINITQNEGSWRAGIGQIFDISKLDQPPVVVVQGNPQYPFEMRRAGISGSVTVDFIVDTQGNVRNAYAITSTQSEFEVPAIQAVNKWRFRPGKKSGHMVNTHMQVPISFVSSD
jgi:protein TonB